MAPPSARYGTQDLGTAVKEDALQIASLRVVSCNILSWKSANEANFPTVARLARDPAHRMHLLKTWLAEEIRKESIICMYQVGRMQLELIETFLKDRNYHCHNDFGASGNAANDFASIVMAYPTSRIEALHIEKPKIAALQHWPDPEVTRTRSALTLPRP